MRTRVVCAAVGVALIGCGARSELSDASGAGGAASSTSSASSSTSSSGGGGAGGSPCTWGFGPVVALDGGYTEVVDGDHLLYATSHHHQFDLQTLSLDLASLGPRQPLPLDPKDYDFGPVLAAGQGHGVAMLSSQLHGCQAVAIAADGSSLGGVTTVSQGTCASAIATPSGFFVVSGHYAGSPYLVTPPLDVVGLTANATVAATTPGVVMAPTGPDARLSSAVLDDGSTILVWSLDSGSGAFAQRFDAMGVPLTAAKQLLPTGFYLAAVTLGSSVLLTWNDGATFDTNSIRAATLDASLNLGGIHAVVPAPSTSFVVNLVDGGPGPGKFLLRRVKDSVPIVGQWIADDGSPIGEPFTGQLSVEGPPVSVVATPAGPIVFGGIGAQRVLCQ
jgi:hypothetical protein